jgi:hypothetical protein
LEFIVTTSGPDLGRGRDRCFVQMAFQPIDVGGITQIRQFRGIDQALETPRIEVRDSDCLLRHVFLLS